MARCPECNARMSLPDGIGQWSHFFCESCGTKLEILNLNPLELETVYDDDDEDILYELDDEDEQDWEEDDVVDGEDEEEDDDLDDDEDEEW